MSAAASSLLDVLREEKGAHFAAGFMRRRLIVGGRAFAPISAGALRAIMRAQADRPQVVARADRLTFWLYRERVYRDDEGLDAVEVAALLADRERRRRRRIERALDLMEADRQREATPRREPIGEAVRREVFRRDGGCCVACGSRELLQFDHIIPVAMGGASTIENLQLLCADCNRAKGASL
jgi:5-methylcytosine-specific restriction endonuclease McrA